jgi:hypothetical protein
VSDWPEDIAAALRRHEVVAITSGITDLREAAELLDRALPDRWTRVEWGMGSALNRSRFHDMQQRSGFHMLPMFVTRDAVIGGTTELRRYLDAGGAIPAAASQGARAASAPGLIPLLGYSGLIPFVFFGVSAWVPQEAWHDFALYALGVYAAVILSFLGAVHWGLYLADPEHRAARLPGPVWAVIPSVAAWGALLLPLSMALPLLALMFPLVLLVDRASLPGHWVSGKYMAMRGYLTLGATLTLIAGFLASLSMS